MKKGKRILAQGIKDIKRELRLINRYLERTGGLPSALQGNIPQDQLPYFLNPFANPMVNQLYQKVIALEGLFGYLMTQPDYQPGQAIVPQTVQRGARQGQISVTQPNLEKIQKFFNEYVVKQTGENAKASLEKLEKDKDGLLKLGIDEKLVEKSYNSEKAWLENFYSNALSGTKDLIEFLINPQQN